MGNLTKQWHWVTNVFKVIEHNVTSAALKRNSEAMVSWRSYSNWANPLWNSQCKFKRVNFLLFSTPLLLPAHCSWHLEIIAKTKFVQDFTYQKWEWLSYETANVHIHMLPHTWRAAGKVGRERASFSWHLTPSPLTSNELCWQSSLGCCLRKSRSCWKKEELKEARKSLRSKGNTGLSLGQWEVLLATCLTTLDKYTGVSSWCWISADFKSANLMNGFCATQSLLTQKIPHHPCHY